MMNLNCAKKNSKPAIELAFILCKYTDNLQKCLCTLENTWKPATQAICSLFTPLKTQPGNTIAKVRPT
jgi:hypothetical protein